MHACEMYSLISREMNSELKYYSNKLMPEYKTPPLQNSTWQKRSESHQVAPDPPDSRQKTTKTWQHHMY